MSVRSWELPRILPDPRDERWQGLLRGLDQLRNDELIRLLHAIDDPGSFSLLTDSANYSPIYDRWCALAVAIDLPVKLKRLGLNVRTNSGGRAALIEIAALDHPNFAVNPLSGVPGEWFTLRRPQDLRIAVIGILRLRATAPEASKRREWNLESATQVIEALSMPNA